MTLIPRAVVVLAILLASTSATPPAGYVKQPDDDKNPASYRYKYEVEDEALGDNHGKAEVREGEHAQGRYYVNSARATTDVKYVADEWGYHPLVKYAAADDHSSASASFAFGEKAVNDLLNEKNGQLENEPRQQHHQLLQTSYSTGENETSIQSGPSSKPLTLNYITGEPQLIEPVSAGGNELFFLNGHQAPAIQQDNNNLSSEDEHLLVENAGSFGQRNQEVQDSTTVSPSTRGGRYFHGRTRQKNNKPYLPDTVPGLGAYSSSSFPPLQDNSVGSELESDIPVTTPSPLLINYGASQLSSKTAQDFLATLEKSERHGFAKPIVVPEVSRSEQSQPFQYSTTFECADDEPITANPLQASDSASSHILNPIQAGVSLVNAGETHLIGDSESPPPAPVNEHVDDTPPQSQIIGNSIVGQQSAGNYVGVNPAFGGVHDEARSTTTAQPPTQNQLQRQDNEVEVQKSIEIYSSSPAGSQELQLTNEQQKTTIDQQQYLATLAELGSQQLGSTRTRSESFSKIYEISDNYPKDSAADKPVYVVPPATYVLDDSSVLKNSLLQEKTQQQQYQEIGQAEIKKQRQQPYRSFEKKKIPISHPYPIPVVPVPIPIEKVIERKVPVPVHIPIPHPYPVEKPVHIPVPIEKIVEKPVHIPIPVEKIIEKKIPVSQPYPIEVTKYVEKPVIVHAPYGVHYGVSYQQIMKPQNHGLYGSLAGQVFGHGNLNHSQVFQGYVYDKPAIPFHEGKENHLEYKKLPYNSYIPPSYQQSGSNSLFHRRHTQPQRDDYFGPVPPPQQHVQRQFGFQSKQSYVAYPERPQQLQPGLRKSRNHEPPLRYQKGNFRQSKIEYGFKPPMVPSVQYDEETASKVES